MLPAEALDLAGTSKKLMGEYRHVRGHHVHAKKAFEGHVNYDPKKGFSISEELMSRIGVRHADVTTAQRRWFGELARSGKPNTLKAHSQIAVQALIEGGASRDHARSIVARSLRDLKNQGVREPVNIPWNVKK